MQDEISFLMPRKVQPCAPVVGLSFGRREEDASGARVDVDGGPIADQPTAIDRIWCGGGGTVVRIDEVFLSLPAHPLRRGGPFAPLRVPPPRLVATSLFPEIPEGREMMSNC